MRNKLETWHYPKVSNYADAVEAWNKGDRFRDYPEWRKIVHGHLNKWIERHEDTSIGFKLGGVEMVRWFADDSVVIRPCSSTLSFTAFANAFLPSDLRVEFNAGSYASCWVGRDVRHYRVIQRMRFKRSPMMHVWTPQAKPEPWVCAHLDKAAGRAALVASGYTEFMTWAKAVALLGGWRRMSMDAPNFTLRMVSFNGSTIEGRRLVMAALARRECWEELLLSPTLTDYASDPLTALQRLSVAIRDCVYGASGAIKTTSVPYLEGTSVVDKHRRKERMYRAALADARQ